MATTTTAKPQPKRALKSAHSNLGSRAKGARKGRGEASLKLMESTMLQVPAEHFYATNNATLKANSHKKGGNPVAQEASDPILAAIEAHKKAFSAFHVVVTENPVMEEKWGMPDKASNAGKKAWAKYSARYETANDAEQCALNKLCNTAPRTVDGAIALSTYIESIREYDEALIQSDQLYDLATSLGKYLRAAQVRPASSGIAALGERLCEQWRTYALNRPRYEELQGDANELLYQALIERPSELKVGDKGYWALDTKSKEQSGFDKVEKIHGRSQDAMSATIEMIEKLKARTLEDLAVLANVCATTNPDLWECPAIDLDWEVQSFRVLVDEVLRLAGKKLILEGLPIPQRINQDAPHRAHEFWEGKAGRPSKARKANIFRAFLKVVKEFGSPDTIDPKELKVRVYQAVNSYFPCTLQELRLTLDEAEPIMNAPTKRAG
jgi:hypothetical protein